MIHFEKKFEGHRFIVLGGRRLGELEQSSNGRKLWSVYIDGKRIVDSHGYDSFSLSTAKVVAKQKLQMGV